MHLQGLRSPQHPANIFQTTMSRPSTSSTSASTSYDWLFPHESPSHHMNAGTYGPVRPATPELKKERKMSMGARTKALLRRIIVLEV